MTAAKLTIDISAILANWQALDALTECPTAAVVKADAYGLGAVNVAKSLARAGVREFFVAIASEGAVLRRALGPGPKISVFSGHMAGDTDMIRDADLIPMINSLDQMVRHVESLPDQAFGLQLDTGMNRLGMEIAEWGAVAEIALSLNPTLIMSHLACADAPDHPMNAQQKHMFDAMTQGMNVPRSMAATGGILLGPEYHYDLTRPGVGLYGGLPFAAAKPVVSLDIPVIQVRDVEEGETVGYDNAWTAQRPARIATIAAGYADGLIRAMGPKAKLQWSGRDVPVVGRVSMDLITVDVTELGEDPDHLRLIGDDQTVDMVADAAGTIGYEILTSLGARYERSWTV